MLFTKIRYGVLSFTLLVLGFYLSIYHAIFVLLGIPFVYQLYYVPLNYLHQKCFNRELVIPIPSRQIKFYAWYHYVSFLGFVVYWLYIWLVLGEVANCLSGFPHWFSSYSFCRTD